MFFRQTIMSLDEFANNSLKNIEFYNSYTITGRLHDYIRMEVKK